MEKYQYQGKVGSGAFGQVWKCKVTQSGMEVAVKRLEGVGSSTEARRDVLRELCLLRLAQHKNVVSLFEAYHGRSGNVYIVQELTDRPLSRDLLHHPRGLPAPRVKVLAWQLLMALQNLHSKQIVHCDLKPGNVLINGTASVKLCDFGSARCAPLERLCPLLGSKHDGAPSERSAVASRWYSAPEVLLGGEPAGTPQDMWAFGCLLAELSLGKPLLPGNDNVDQVRLITRMVGRLSPRHAAVVALLPAEQRGPIERCLEGEPALNSLPRVSSDLRELLRACLTTDPAARITATQALAMPYFEDLRRAYQASAMGSSASFSSPSAFPGAVASRMVWESVSASADASLAVSAFPSGASTAGGGASPVGRSVGGSSSGGADGTGTSPPVELALGPFGSLTHQVGEETLLKPLPPPSVPPGLPLSTRASLAGISFSGPLSSRADSSACGYSATAISTTTTTISIGGSIVATSSTGMGPLPHSASEQLPQNHHHHYHQQQHYQQQSHDGRHHAVPAVRRAVSMQQRERERVRPRISALTAKILATAASPFDCDGDYVDLLVEVDQILAVLEGKPGKEETAAVPTGGPEGGISAAGAGMERQSQVQGAASSLLDAGGGAASGAETGMPAPISPKPCQASPTQILSSQISLGQVLLGQISPWQISPVLVSPKPMEPVPIGMLVAAASAGGCGSVPFGPSSCSPSSAGSGSMGSGLAIVPLGSSSFQPLCTGIGAAVAVAAVPAEQQQQQEFISLPGLDPSLLPTAGLPMLALPDLDACPIARAASGGCPGYPCSPAAGPIAAAAAAAAVAAASVAMAYNAAAATTFRTSATGSRRDESVMAAHGTTAPLHLDMIEPTGMVAGFVAPGTAAAPMSIADAIAATMPAIPAVIEHHLGNGISWQQQQQRLGEALAMERPGCGTPPLAAGGGRSTGELASKAVRQRRHADGSATSRPSSANANAKTNTAAAAGTTIGGSLPAGFCPSSKLPGSRMRLSAEVAAEDQLRSEAPDTKTGLQNHHPNHHPMRAQHDSAEEHEDGRSVALASTASVSHFSVNDSAGVPHSSCGDGAGEGGSDGDVLQPLRSSKAFLQGTDSYRPPCHHRRSRSDGHSGSGHHRRSGSGSHLHHLLSHHHQHLYCSIQSASQLCETIMHQSASQASFTCSSQGKTNVGSSGSCRGGGCGGLLGSSLTVADRAGDNSKGIGLGSGANGKRAPGAARTVSQPLPIDRYVSTGGVTMLSAVVGKGGSGSIGAGNGSLVYDAVYRRHHHNYSHGVYRYHPSGYHSSYYHHGGSKCLGGGEIDSGDGHSSGGDVLLLAHSAASSEAVI